MGIANAAEEEENLLGVNENLEPKAVECCSVVLVVSDAAMDLKLVGGACRKDPTYGLFLLAPSLLELSRTDVACLRSVLLGA